MLQTQPETERRHDLDWLRVGAFLLLILYHVGMFYVPWPWHVKSEHAPVDALRIPMLLSNSWRLPLLFFISGVAMRFALDKSSHGRFLGNRFVRLFLPLVFGMWVVCAPQAYFELLNAGIIDGDVPGFYRRYAAMPWASPESWPIITPTWNHLWYVLYVLVYTLLLGAISLLSNRRLQGALDAVARNAMRFPNTSLVLLLPGLFVLVLIALKASYGAQQTLWGDWHNLLASGITLLTGFTVARNEAFWAWLRRRKWWSLWAATLLSLLIVWNAHAETLEPLTRAVVRIAHGWAVLYALLGFAQALTNADSPRLRYLTAAVFPYYVLHQTLIIVAGSLLSDAQLPLMVESVLVLLVTFLGCAFLYHVVIRRMGRWGVLLGAAPSKRH